jgi:NAD(P)H-hydrate epimerase
MRCAWPNPERASRRLAGDAFVLTAAQSREVDRLALAEFGLPTLVLMENAARAVAEVALGALRGADAPSVLILAGPGNNGGDALAAARHLHNAGAAVEVVLAYPQEACKSDCALHLSVVTRMGIPVRTWDVGPPLASMHPSLIIDGVFGTGLARGLDAGTAALVRAANDLAGSGPLVLAVDVPTGMDADTGGAVAGSPVVRADATIAFAALKPGLLAAHAASFVGTLIVSDIGVPRELVRRLGTPAPKPLPSHARTAS